MPNEQQADLITPDVIADMRRQVEDDMVRVLSVPFGLGAHTNTATTTTTVTAADLREMMANLDDVMNPRPRRFVPCRVVTPAKAIGADAHK